MSRILVTGSAGLIGRKLVQILKSSGIEVIEFDSAYEATHSSYGDILNKGHISQKIKGCNGIVHLAALSRVIWGEKFPALCQFVNQLGTKNLLDEALGLSQKPWFLYASSREVYGEPKVLPVREEASLKPLNVYAKTKVYAENLVGKARKGGLHTSILRFSNVFGGVQDHKDRVIPAFCLGALAGNSLRVEGSKNLFDFTYLDDVVRGIVSAVRILEHEHKSLPPIHLTTGVGTTLMEAAKIITKKAESGSKIIEHPSRTFDVSRFKGDPARAQSILGWGAHYTFEAATVRFLRDLKEDMKHREKFDENTKSYSRISARL